MLREWQEMAVDVAEVEQLEGTLEELDFWLLKILSEEECCARVWVDDLGNRVAIVQGFSDIMVGSDWPALPIIHDL